MPCPYCHQNAPTIVRGVRTYCTSCGAQRSIVDAPEAVNLAGQPSKVGGGIASALGWVALVGGLSLALLFGVFLKLLFPLGAALAVGGVISIFTLVLALPLILGGQKLQKQGTERAREAQEHAVFALAARRRGVLTVRELARSLSIREEEADTLLTELAKRPDGRVTLEVDDGGGISYAFHDLRSPPQKVRFDASAQQQARARVRAPDEQPRVVDAELIEEEEDEARPRPRQVWR